jgi:hypothetical protein
MAPEDLDSAGYVVEGDVCVLDEVAAIHNLPPHGHGSSRRRRLVGDIEGDTVAAFGLAPLGDGD